MVDSSLILQYIQAEQVSDAWRVLRPRNQIRLVTFSGIIVFGPLFNILAFGFGYTLSNQQLSDNLSDLYVKDPLLAIVAHGIAIGLAIGLTLLLRSYAITMQDAVFVLLPEGIFHCKHLSNENARSIEYIEYKNIQRMVLEVSEGDELVQRKVATFDLSPLDPSSLQENKPVPPIFGRFEFHFYDTDGTKTTWFPPQIYRTGLQGIIEIAQWVLTDYRAFALSEVSKQQNHF